MQADTVTEDLDLSYERNWRLAIRLPVKLFRASELPVTLAAFRGQQQTLGKGFHTDRPQDPAEAPGEPLPLPVKCEALAHLLANFCWLIAPRVSHPLPHGRFTGRVGPWQILRLDVPLFLATSVAILTYFFMFLHGERQPGSFSRSFFSRDKYRAGAEHCALRSQGGLEQGGIFERTPKFGIVGRASLPVQSFLYRRTDLSYLFLNTILFCYSLLPVTFACQRSTWYALPFFALFPADFSM